MGMCRSDRKGGKLPHGGRSRDGRSRQDRWADDRAWTVSWMSMNRIDQYPGRGSGSSCRDQKNPANVTAAAGEPDDHPDGQDPRRGSQRHHDEARDGDGQPDVPHSEGPDSHPPVSVVLQLRRLVHARDCSTMARSASGRTGIPTTRPNRYVSHSAEEAVRTGRCRRRSPGLASAVRLFSPSLR